MLAVRTASHKPALFWLCLFALCWSAFVLIAGGWTTSINAGMAFPDWPLSNGSVNPDGFLVVADQTAEHSHRLFAEGLGLLSLLIAYFTYRKEAREWVRKLACGLVGLVIFQGVLGGCRVMFDPENFKDLSGNVSRTFAISHAVTALLTVGLIASLVVVQSRRWLSGLRNADCGLRIGERASGFSKTSSCADNGAQSAIRNPQSAISPTIRALAITTATGVWIQALLGALVRQHRWGIWDMAGRPADANPARYLGEWATGKFLSQMSSGWPYALNLAHRLGALVVAGLVLALAGAAFADRSARRALGGFAALLAGVTLFQIMLGVTQLWFNGNVLTRNAHHLGGAVVFCTATALALFAHRECFSGSSEVRA